MFEVGDIVKFRDWTDRIWSEEDYEIIDSHVSYEAYDDKFIVYTIKNIQTEVILYEVNWQQIKLK